MTDSRSRMSIAASISFSVCGRGIVLRWRRALHLERDIFGDFRTAGAAFLDGAGVVDPCFRAQHVGMPTRLLDWSTNPLAALASFSADRTRVDFVMELRSSSS
jgi:hypothetical protein